MENNKDRDMTQAPIGDALEDEKKIQAGQTEEPAPKVEEQAKADVASKDAQPGEAEPAESAAKESAR